MRESEGAAQRREGEGISGYDKLTLQRAKALRRELTDTERKLWSVLRNSQLAGAKFRRQQPIGPYIVDFVCPAECLVVEADGGQHSDDPADVSRTRFLNSRGYRVLRFWNNDILTNLAGVAQTIAEALSTPHPAQPRIGSGTESPSPSRGEGNHGAPNG